MEDKISVFFSADENYARYCATTILSILDNTSSPEKLEFHILSPDITQENTQKFRRICAEFNAQISVIHIDMSLFSSLPELLHLSLNAYSRLLIPDLCEKEKIIYLDCDLIVLGDILELFQCELGGKPIGSVPHVQFPYQDFFKQNFDVQGDDICFNSGVMLIDTAYWRERGYVKKVLKCAEKYSSKLHFGDQDALNAIFWRNYCHLLGVWNVETRLYKEKLLGLPQNEEITKRMQNPKIIHYTGADKPWASKKYVPMRHLYTYYSKQLSQKFSWYPSKDEPKQCTISSFLNFAWSCLYFRTSYNINKIFYKS
ncbi:glycosyltransferase family 8 protein [Anabaena minutissima FACHB-250]|nr:glycosyltransferase family 8 protein [Anabaena minutissima FACHB-250]